MVMISWGCVPLERLSRVYVGTVGIEGTRENFRSSISYKRGRERGREREEVTSKAFALGRRWWDGLRAPREAEVCRRGQ